MRSRPAVLMLWTLLVTACVSTTPPLPSPPSTTSDTPEATSLLGEALYRPTLPTAFRAEQERLLDDAERAWAEDAADADALIWIGRRLGYLGRYREALATFARGAELFPNDARFPRHRGHRLITVRRLDDAVRELERGLELVAGVPDEIEPDGLPNEHGEPRSTLHTNLWYHLALARYLRGDFAGATDDFRACLDASPNDDMRVASSYWLYLALRRLDRDGEAAAVLEPIVDGLEILENHDYHRLLLTFKGERDPAALLAESETGSLGFSTTAYGLGAWHLVEGREADARALFRRIAAGDGWAAFGYVAAEAELARNDPPPL